MSKPMVIYVPSFQPLVFAKVRKYFPDARIVQSWEEGAIMWHDALKGKL